MKVSVKQAGPCRQTLKIEVPAESVNAEREELLKAYCKSAALPGFRKGHAPRALVEKKFAKDILEDVKERSVSKFYHEAIEQEAVKVVQIIDVDEPEMKDNGSLHYSVTVDVRPEIKLPKYDGISIKAEKTDVEEKQVDETIGSIRRRYADFVDVEGRVAAEGDMVQLAYEATVDGIPLEEKAPEARGMGHGSGYWVSCDDESFLPGMGRALMGAGIGDRKEVKVSFPADFIVKDLAGLTAQYKVEVTGMREMRLPEMDADFLGKLRVDSEEELRKNIRQHLEESAQARETGRRENEICTWLLQKTKLDVPESDLSRQTRSVMYDLTRQRMMQGASQEKIKEDREELMKEAREKGEEQVKLRYIVAAIADAENVEASDDEVSGEVIRLAIERRRDAAELRKELEKEDQMDAVREQVRFNKTLALLRERAKIK